MKRILTLTLLFLLPFSSFAQLKVLQEGQAMIICAFDVYNGIGVIQKSNKYQLMCVQTSNQFDSGLYIDLGETKEEAINTLGDLCSLCSDQKGKEITFDAGNSQLCNALVEDGYLRLSANGIAGHILVHKYTLGSLMKNLSLNEFNATSMEEYVNGLKKEEIARIRYWNTSIQKVGDCFYLSANLDADSFDMYLGSSVNEADLTLKTLQEYMKMDKGKTVLFYGSSQKEYSINNESLLEKMITFRATGYDKYSLYGAYLNNLISKLNSQN